MPPATADVTDALSGLLDSLALAATSNKTAVQKLTATNNALTTLVSTLVAANKKLTETVAHFNLPPNLCGGGGGQGSNGAQHSKPTAIWGNYCWLHGYKVSHKSKTYGVTGRNPGHDDLATIVDMKGGLEYNKDWYLQGEKKT